MTSTTFFDDALPKFARLAIDRVGQSIVEQSIFLRTAPGRLSLVVPPDACSSAERLSLSEEVAQLISPYGDPDNYNIVTADELFDDSLKNLQSASKLVLEHSDYQGMVNVIDRRVVGADWLLPPAPSAMGAKRFVFASLKGGVGRSTALSVLAAHLSAKGKRVLTIDMDLEAPGIGFMLLDETALPQFGLLDYLVESPLSNTDDTFFTDMIGHSWLGGGRGRVDVIPAVGSRSQSNPANVLAKLARAYLPSSDDTGTYAGFADRVSSLVDRFSSSGNYDYILVDARAGLHESTAAPLLSLGANILFFGVDQSQTYAGYELLLAHLAAYSIEHITSWAENIYFVQAKAPAVSSNTSFSENVERILSNYTQRNTEDDSFADLSIFEENIEIEWPDESSDELLIGSMDDRNAIITIAYDERFRISDMNKDREILTGDIYRASYGEFLRQIESIAGEDVEDEA